MATTSTPYRKPLVIDAQPTMEGEKTRQFRAELLCVVAAPTLWELGSTSRDNTVRPVLLAYAASEQESRAFSANLRAGRAAAEDANRGCRLKFEIPRSAGFRFDTHTRDGATLTVAYLPPVFALQPGTGGEDAIRFLFMPPTWWVDREAATLPEFGKDAREAALAAYFVAFLDQRSPLPIANDLRFHLELYRAARASDWCHPPQRSGQQVEHLYAEGCATLGFEPPLVATATHPAFSAFLAEQTAQHLPREQETTHGKARVASARRLLPDAAGAPRERRVSG
jgi:hypothetical protein